MKKIALIAVAACLTLGFTSCKKDYTCTCTVGGVQVSTVTYKKVKKKDAESACSSAGTVGGTTYSCSLK